MKFFNSLIFFFYFFQNFLARVECELNSGLKFFFLFFSLSHPVLAKNKAGETFFSFLNFFTVFFLNFLVCVEYERNPGLKFFSLFLGLSHPVFAKNNARKRFFNILNFFAILLEFSCPGRVWTVFGTKIFFSLSRPISSRFG